MTVIEALILSVLVIIGIVLVFSVPIMLVNGVDSIIENIRRKKYPAYWVLYDNAIKCHFATAYEFCSARDRVKNEMEVLMKELQDGKCTNESFEKKMSELSIGYMKLCDEYRERKEYTDSLWRAVERYAKEYKLKWSGFYDS